MSEHVLESVVTEPRHASPKRRHAVPDLILTELSADAVVDHLDDAATPVPLITFGSVREPCPKCQHNDLKLVLRQQRVRLAHLFCAGCNGCFDAHYPDGASALTI